MKASSAVSAEIILIIKDIASSGLIHSDYIPKEIADHNLGAIGYTFGEAGLFSLDLGYRYMDIELKNEESGATTKTNVVLSGPMLGFIVTF